MPEHFTLTSIEKLDHYIHVLPGTRRANLAVIDQRELGALALRLWEDYLMDNIIFTQAAMNHGWRVHVVNGVPQIQGSGFLYRLRNGEYDLVATLSDREASFKAFRKHHGKWATRFEQWRFQLQLWFKTQVFRRSLS